MHGLPSPPVETVHGYVEEPVTVTVPPPRSVARAAQCAPDVVMETAPVALEVIVPSYVAYSPREESFVVVIVIPSFTVTAALSQAKTAFAYFAVVLTVQPSSVIELPLPTATIAELRP
jgi:hypothetical protein